MGIWQEYYTKVVGVIYHVCTQGQSEWPISFENLVENILLQTKFINILKCGLPN